MKEGWWPDGSNYNIVEIKIIIVAIIEIESKKCGNENKSSLDDKIQVESFALNLKAFQLCCPLNQVEESFAARVQILLEDNFQSQMDENPKVGLAAHVSRMNIQ